MRKSSDSFPLVVVLAISALWFLGKNIFDNLVYAALMRLLTEHFGVQEAQVIAGFSAIAAPLCFAALIVVGLYKYLHLELSRQLKADPAAHAGITVRELQAQHDATTALREHTEELVRQREANSPARKQIDRWMENISIPRPLNIVVGTGGSFERVKATSIRDRERTFYLRVENHDRHKPLTNCKVDITNVTPIPCPDRGMPWTLEQDFSLAAGEHKFIKLAQYEEATEVDLEFRWREKLMVIFSHDPKNWLLLEIKEQTLEIRATSPDSGYCDIKCKLWVDENWRFRIEKL
jgi:hypothetical protein